MSIESADIMLFFSKSSAKSNNDKENKKRETILSKILNGEFKDYFKESTKHFGQWQQIRDKWNHCICSLCPTTAQKINIKQTGGRQYNYDFLVTFNDSSDAPIKVEFKHNVRHISRLPQILSMAANNTIFAAENYAEFYYDNFLQRYIETDEALKFRREMIMFA